MNQGIIPFNNPLFLGQEGESVLNSINENRKFSGNGQYTQKCQKLIEEQLQVQKSLLTTSCTTALEMSSLLAEIEPGDEVIIPSFTFVSTANAFLLRGAEILFVDSQPGNPNLSIKDLEKVISKKTKVIVPVHYAGVACEMDSILALASTYNSMVVEDAAQAYGCFYKDKALGSIGDLGTFSFHETKNLNCGEGGALCVNNPNLISRAEIIWEKGTNRAAFFRGEIDKYNWVDIGSSCLPSELNAAFLYPQLLQHEMVNKKRVQLWEHYHNSLEDLEKRNLIERPSYQSDVVHNGHIYFITCRSLEERTQLIQHMKSKGIHTFFHYQALHRSPYFHKISNYKQRTLPMADLFTDQILRLPMYFDLSLEDVSRVVNEINEFYKKL